MATDITLSLSLSLSLRVGVMSLDFLLSFCRGGPTLHPGRLGVVFSLAGSHLATNGFLTGGGEATEQNHEECIRRVPHAVHERSFVLRRVTHVVIVRPP